MELSHFLRETIITQKYFEGGKHEIINYSFKPINQLLLSVGTL